MPFKAIHNSINAFQSSSVEFKQLDAEIKIHPEGSHTLTRFRIKRESAVSSEVAFAMSVLKFNI
jgi:hypothetical protein